MTVSERMVRLGKANYSGETSRLDVFHLGERSKNLVSKAIKHPWASAEIRNDFRCIAGSCSVLWPQLCGTLKCILYLLAPASLCSCRKWEKDRVTRQDWYGPKSIQRIWRQKAGGGGAEAHLRSLERVLDAQGLWHLGWHLGSAWWHLRWPVCDTLQTTLSTEHLLAGCLNFLCFCSLTSKRRKIVVSPHEVLRELNELMDTKHKV